MKKTMPLTGHIMVPLTIAVFIFWTISARAQHARAAMSKTENSKPMPKNSPAPLPPLPAGVAELKFNEFFVSPIGDRGLTLTEKVQSLDGKRVRILGYMAQQEKPAPGMFLFHAVPVRLCEEHYGLAEDFPGATLFVFMPKDRERMVPYTPGLMLLTGTLSVGNREEIDGRISTVRLALELPEKKSQRKGAQFLRRAK